MREILSLLLLGALTVVCTAQESERSNVLFLFADDFRPDAVGAFGNSHIATPNIDGLARRGFRFARNYCMGSIHGAVCQPSRAMLMSGRTLYRVPMDLADTPTLGELLGAAGYVTFGTGKWHNGAASFERTFQRARSVFLGGMSDHERVPVREFDEHHRLSEPRIGPKFSSELFADETIRFLEEVRDEKAPFFAYVAFTAPHDPRQPSPRWRQHYDENRPPLPLNFMLQHPFDNGWMTGRDEKLAPWPRPPSMIADQLAEYYGLISHLDEQVGRILAALERTGHAEDTVVVFTADHGLAMGSHGLLGKQSVYEHSMGAPLLIAGPGLTRGMSNALTYVHDLMPTICELAGLTPPAGVEGKSLRPLWQGRATSVRDTLFLTFEDKMRAVRDDRFKLIRYPILDHTQLFDLLHDPHEVVSLAGLPAHRDRVAAMTAELRRWQHEVDDPHPYTAATTKPLAPVDLSQHPRETDGFQPAWIVEKYFR